MLAILRKTSDCIDTRGVKEVRGFMNTSVTWYASDFRIVGF